MLLLGYDNIISAFFSIKKRIFNFLIDWLFKFLSPTDSSSYLFLVNNFKDFYKLIDFIDFFSVSLNDNGMTILDSYYLSNS